MNKLILALVFIAAVSATFLPKEDEVMFKFMKFIRQYNKEYSSVEEFQIRFEIFKHNLSKVEDHERFVPHMDVSEEEFKNKLTLSAAAIPKSRANSSKYESTLALGELPDTHDWISKGAVTPVKDQGSCGSCWAFSAIANIEGQDFLTNGKLRAFSEQQLVDCDRAQDQGCNGGLMDNAFTYFQTKKVMLGSDYPYKGRDETCKYNETKGQFNVKSFKDVSQNENDLATAVFELGPISVAVDASAFQFFQGGHIMTGKECNYSQLNHGVTVVGFGVEKGVKFWMVKNSWGQGWGEKGYIRIERGVGACGINMAASSALLK